MTAFGVDLALGFVIGLTLGLLGGGGSILTVPALVYIVGLSPQAAVTASLVIVGANSLAGAATHRAQGTLNWTVALVFGGSGMVVSFLSAGLSRLVSSHVLLVLFALLMLAVGALMILRKTGGDEARPSRGWPVIVASGAGVGLMTGFLGVGGGFLIVPALVMLVGLPMRQAVGTSLIVIAMNSLAGFLGHLGGPPIDFGVVALFVVAGVAGALTGAQLARRANAATLRTAFAVFVVGLGIALLADNLRYLV